MHQLIPGAKLPAADTYHGPVSMLRRAFEATESLGSLTVVLAVMARSNLLQKNFHLFFLVDQIKSSISSTFHLDFISFSLKSVFLWYISLSVSLSFCPPSDVC